MTTRRPIVLVNGRQKELPATDRVYGGGCVPLRLLTDEKFFVPANNQALYSQPITLDAGAELVLDGMLVEVN